MEDSRRLVVRGFVQGVGYRAFIQMMARRLGIRGIVRNLNDGNVEVIVTGRPESIEKFAKLIEIKAESPFEPDVHEIEVEDYAGHESFDDFRIDYGYDMTVAEKEMIERSEIGILAFGWMGKYLGNKMDTGFSELGEKIDSLSEKTDTGFSELGEKIDTGFSELGEKIDTLSEKTDKGFSELGEKMDTGFSELGEKIDNVGQKVDTVGNKIDALSEKTDKGFSELGEKIDKSSVESSARLDTVSKNTGELNEKIDSLSQELPVIVDKVDRFREDTIGAFGELDRKYHVISQNLERLNGNIERMVDDLGILIREFVEEKRRNEGSK